MLDGVYTKISSHQRVQQVQTHDSAKVVAAAAPLAFSLLQASVVSFLSDVNVCFPHLLSKTKA